MKAQALRFILPIAISLAARYGAASPEVYAIAPSNIVDARPALISCANFSLQNKRRNEMSEDLNKMISELEGSEDWQITAAKIRILVSEATANMTAELLDPVFWIELPWAPAYSDFAKSSVLLYRDGDVVIHTPTVSGPIYVRKDHSAQKLIVPIRYQDICNGQNLRLVVYPETDVTYSQQLGQFSGLKQVQAVQLRALIDELDKIDGHFTTLEDFSRLTPGRFEMFNCRIEVEQIPIVAKNGRMTYALRFYARDRRYRNEVSLALYLEDTTLNSQKIDSTEIQTWSQTLSLGEVERISQLRIHRRYGYINLLDLSEVTFNPYEVRRRVKCQPHLEQGNI